MSSLLHLIFRRSCVFHNYIVRVIISMGHAHRFILIYKFRPFKKDVVLCINDTDSEDTAK